MGAEQALLNNQSTGLVNVVFRLIHRFLKQFVYRFDFLEDIPGIVNAYLGAYSVFLKYAILIAMKRDRKKKIEIRKRKAGTFPNLAG